LTALAPRSITVVVAQREGATWTGHTFAIISLLPQIVALMALRNQELLICFVAGGEAMLIRSKFINIDRLSPTTNLL
jgi:hypothetical protein